MSAEWRARCDAVLEQALTLGPAERRAFLEKACGTNQRLRAEVDRLLGRDEASAAFLEAGAASVARALGAPTGAADAARHRPGEVVDGRFTLVALLGAGGMGEVFGARDNELGRDVALKFLHDDLAARESLPTLLAAEARAICTLAHPHICTLYDLRWSGELPYLVMEWLRGETLAARLSSGPMPLDEAGRAALQIASALSHAHRAGVVHRDLKPGNIMLTPDGVKVFDFGIAKRLDPHGSAANTTRAPGSTVVGSASYMSPEQAAGRQIDARTDIFSFGCVLYEMLSGRRTFVGASFAETIAAVLHDAPVALDRVAPSTPPAVAVLVQTCLQKNPDQRFRDMAAVEGALRAALDGMPVVRRHARRLWLPLAGGITLAMAAAVGLGKLRAPGGDSGATGALNPVPLTAFTQEEFQPSLSPDGTQVVFAGNVEDTNNGDLYVQMVGSGATPLRLTTHAADESAPIWSPDGRWIVFQSAAHETRPGGVYRITPLGGQQTRILERDCSPGSWAPDGSWFLCADKTTGAIFAVGADGSRANQLTHPPPGARDYGPEISPDGAQMLFARQPKINFLAELHVAEVRADGTLRRTPTPLIALEGALTGATWLPGGSEVVIGASDYGRDLSALYRLHTAVAHPALTKLPLPDGGIEPRLSRRGDRLVYTQITFDTDIWLEAGGKAQALRVSSTKMDMHPQLSPDGRQLAFSSNRSGSWQVWVADIDGSRLRQLTSDQAVFNGHWSPDGSRIVFCDAGNPRGRDIYLVDAAGGRPTKVTGHPGIDMIPSFSHDGRSLYFISDRTGDMEVFRMAIDGTGVRQITRGAPRPISPMETSDGRHVVYGSLDGGIRIVPAEGGESRVLVRDVRVRDMVVAPDGVYFLEDSPMPLLESRLMFYDFAIEATRQARVLPGEAINISVGRDGTVAYGRMARRGTDLMVVEGFR